ncbi:MAG: 1-deoxy-D-xylulose-5-phosphate reductoisomerase [Arsenophonus sp.]|nr:MAG: 1-deoxy-D-xylulose-5-phosphate reductoisomerase [Arsenophonus sp.]
MINLTILGSTGSIGRTTLSIVRKYPKKFTIIVLVANKNFLLLSEQCLFFKPKYAVMSDEDSANKLKIILNQAGSLTKVLCGNKEIFQIISISEVDQIVCATTGIAGLPLIFAAIRQGKRILLANKESLVVSGNMFFKMVKKYNAQVFPIDSEHNAIFRILPSEAKKKLGFINLKRYGIKNIILTGSGGPFKNVPINQLKFVTPKQACQHPIWSMGNKISVDSATMMNKGLEYIEAHYLFNADLKEIEIVIHPQSIIHSMIRYEDGTIIAQFGIPDMKIPIAYSMGYPHSSFFFNPISIDFKKLSSVTFSNPNYSRYPCLKLAIDACREGQVYIIALNAINEIAVEYFLKEKIKFTDIAKINRNILEKINFKKPSSLNEILEIDNEIRQITIKFIKLFKT